MPNHYELLEIPQEASEKEITQAFHKKALQFHPDKNPGTEEMFKEILNAYEELSDPSKRAEYDRTLPKPFSPIVPPELEKETTNNSTIHLSANEFLFLNPLARNVGQNLSYIAECYFANDGRYLRISYLQIYLENAKNKLFPALTLQEVLETSDQELFNFTTAYRLIKANLLTMEEARNLSEEERQCILSSDTDESWEKLQAYRSSNKTNSAMSNSSNLRKADTTSAQSTTPKVIRELKVSCPAFIIKLAEDTGLSTDYLMACLAEDDVTGNHTKIYFLSSYLSNLKNNTEPSLTLDEVLATSEQERNNLRTAYAYIVAGQLSLKEVKQLSEPERMCLTTNLIGKGMRELHVYREELNQQRCLDSGLSLPDTRTTTLTSQSQTVSSNLDSPVVNRSRIVLQHKSADTLMCYVANGSVLVDGAGTISLNIKPAQISNTCWFDGPMMLASLSMKHLENTPQLAAVKKYKEETGALFLLEYCFKNFVEQYTVNKLQLLLEHRNLLSVNFPVHFKVALSIAIDSIERKKVLFDHIAIAIQKGKDQAAQALKFAVNKMIFTVGQECLMLIGCVEIANSINGINSLLTDQIKYSQYIKILQKDTIVAWLFDFLTLAECKTPSSPKDLYQLLEQSGPLLAKAMLGIDFYKPNSAKCLHSLLDLQIMGWGKNDVREEEGNLHAIVIIGVKMDDTNPEQSRVYFIDPKQTLDPSSKYKQIYSVSYAKCMSKLKGLYSLAGYALTPELKNEIERLANMKQNGLKRGFFNSNPTVDREKVSGGQNVPDSLSKN